MAKNLPGFRLILPNSTRAITAPAPTGDKLLIIGPALDGPTNTPVRLRQVNDLETFFGPLLFNSVYPPPDGDTSRIGTYSFNDLVKTVQEAALGGATNIYMVRVGGEFATSQSAHLLGGISVQSRFPGLQYNGSQLRAVSTSMGGTVLTIVNQPSNKGPSNVAFTYPATMTYQSVCQAFNTDHRNTVFQLICPQTTGTGTAASTPVAVSTVTLTGGTYGTEAPGDDFAGLSKVALYTALSEEDGTFDALGNLDVDICYVAGIYADDDIANDPLQSFAVALAKFCHNQSRDNYPVLGIIGTRPLNDSSAPSIRQHVARLTTPVNTYDDATTLKVNVAQAIQTGIPYLDNEIDNTGPIDIGREIGIVAGPDLWYKNLSLGSYVGSAAPFVAGFLSTLPAQRAATNQAVPNSVTPAYFFTDKQREKLNVGIDFVEGDPFNTGGGAYITLTQRQPGDATVSITEDVTAAARISDFSNLQIMRIVNVVQSTIEGVCGIYIGRDNTLATIQNMDGQLRTALDTLANSGVVNGTRGAGYDYTILSSPNDATLGRIGVSIWLKPGRQIKRITTTASVR